MKTERQHFSLLTALSFLKWENDAPGTSIVDVGRLSPPLTAARTPPAGIPVPAAPAEARSSLHGRPDARQHEASPVLPADAVLCPLARRETHGKVPLKKNVMAP